MKSILIPLASACLISASLLAHAQQPSPAPSAAQPQKQGSGEWKKMRDFMEGLPEDVRDRFKQAREEAMKDPKIQELREKADAANKELREAMRSVIASKNPDLAGKLEEFMKSKGFDLEKNHKMKRTEGKMDEALQKLPPDERTRLEKAREIAKQAPAVQSAETAMKAAATPEARREAAKAFHKAMREAMITADPSLEEILDKIKPPKAVEAPAPPAMEESK